MTPEAIAWAVGLGLPALTAAILFLANWLHKVSDRVNATAQALADHRTHTAEQYVRSPEIARVEKAVGDLRSEMNQSVENLRAELTHQVSELTKAVYQLIGRNN